MRKIVIGLGSVAFEGLKKKHLYFTDVELKEAGMPAASLELGLLTKAESASFRKRDEYTFSHLTLQEFLAALYVSTKVLKTNADMAKLLQEVDFGDGHLSTFWVFLAGLLHGGMVEILLHAMCDRLCSCTLGWFARMDVLQLYHCFFESHLGKSGIRSPAVGNFLKKRSELNLLIESWRIAVLLKFGGLRLSVSDSIAVSTALQVHSETADLREVDLSGCTVTDAGLEQLISSFQLCRSIKRLKMPERTAMYGSNSSPLQHMAGMSTVLANCARTLEYVNLSYNPWIGNDGLDSLSGGLMECKSLKSLYLDHTGLTSRGASTLCDIVSCLPSLKGLKVGLNDLGDSGLEQLAVGLHCCAHLKQLDLKATEISARSVPILRRMLTSLPLLVELGVDGNGLGDNDLQELLRSVHRDIRLETFTWRP